jgi:hypothetical protein
MYYLYNINTLLYVNTYFLHVFSHSDRKSANDTSYAPTEYLRTPQNVLLAYRTLQLNMNRFNGGMAIAIPGHKFCNMIMTTMSLYGTIRFFGQMPLFAYSIFPVLCTACLFFARAAYCFGGVLNQNSGRLRMSWKVAAANRKMLILSNGNGNHSWEIDGEKQDAASRDVEMILLFIPSCRDLKMEVGDFYTFEVSTIPTYTSIILDNAIALLLTF